MTGAPRIVVVGGGVSGLAAAHRVLELRPDAALTVLEASDRPGGWLGTIERDGFVIERGPDSILAESPGVHALIDRLKIREQVVRTRTDRKGAYVLRAGRMTRIPEGWSLLGPTSVEALSFASVLSPAGRARVLGDLVLSRGTVPESLASFARRRLGWEALERLGQPLASGIYGSDAETLGLDATLPRFAQLEAEHRSIVLGLGAELEKSRGKEAGGTSGARYGLFLAFDRGMQVLIDALASRLGERLSRGEGALAMRRAGVGYEIETARRRITADAVIVALPGPRAAALLASLDPALERGLRKVQHASASTVTFAFPRAAIAHPLDAYGVVVPAVERRRILAMTWASEKWPGRAPHGSVLLRVFVAGPGDGNETGEASELDSRGDEELVRTALREVNVLLGARGAPLFSLVSRFPRAMPRYGLGHFGLKNQVLAQLERWPRLTLAGNSLSGVGIPHAIASGERAAAAVLEAGLPVATAPMGGAGGLA